jgi:capsular polysaccharide biosynthesis protein
VADVKRYLEIGFAHKLLLLAPMVAALIGTAAFVLLQPASYQSSATLWVNGGGVGAQSAAAAQADVINQYLKTNAFALTVAQSSPLGDYLNTHSDATQGSGITSQIKALLGRGGSAEKPSDDAIRTYLAAHVTVAQLGPSELTITMNGPTPDVARGSAVALITQLTTAEVAARTTLAQTQLALYQAQLAEQAKVISADLAAVRDYLAAHPNLAKDPNAAATDPQLSVLQDTASVAKQTYVALLAKIDQTQSDLDLARKPNNGPFRVVDSPETPGAPSLGKQQLIAGGAGLSAGLLLMALVGALLVRLDTTIHSPDEVHRMVGLAVLGATPLSARA